MANNGPPPLGGPIILLPRVFASARYECKCMQNKRTPGISVSKNVSKKVSKKASKKVSKKVSEKVSKKVS